MLFFGSFLFGQKKTHFFPWRAHQPHHSWVTWHPLVPEWTNIELTYQETTCVSLKCVDDDITTIVPSHHCVPSVHKLLVHPASQQTRSKLTNMYELKMHSCQSGVGVRGHSQKILVDQRHLEPRFSLEDPKNKSRITAVSMAVYKYIYKKMLIRDVWYEVFADIQYVDTVQTLHFQLQYQPKEGKTITILTSGQ